MSVPYTIHDPYHASNYHVLGRKAKCLGCIQDDPTGNQPWVDGSINKGERCIRVTSGNGPSTRTQHFHVDCYFRVRNEVMSAFLCNTWKVQPEQGQLRAVSQRQHYTWETEKDIEQREEFSFAADDIPF